MRSRADVDALIAARLIGGVGVGLASLVSPLYISEVSAPRLRGRMVTLFQFAITIGICGALLSNAWLASVARGASWTGESGLFHWMVVSETWRSMLGMETVPSLLFFALCFVIPETPRYLAQRGRTSEALKVLRRVEGPREAGSQLARIEATILGESGSLRQLFEPGLRKALFVALFLAIASELSGITVVLYYGSAILEKAGLSLGQALGGFVSIGIVNVVFTVIAIWLIDIAGRRPLLFIGSMGAFVALVVNGWLFHTGRTDSLALVGMMCLFVACFAFSMGPIKWVVMSEIFPTRIRGRAMAISTVAVWITDGVYNLLFPVARDWLGVPGSFFVFAAVFVPQLLFIWKVMPETMGRSLEEIERSWIP